MSAANLQALCASAIEFFGGVRQLDKLQEECAETIVAVSHLRERRKGATDNLASEVADLIIMTEQAKQLLGKELVEDALEYKMNRLHDRLVLERGRK